ncbi:hypothetical protein [Corynebacterium sp. HMSC076D02]|uniref:hypothetical protein n=1 Tax=Corynebacterium sp. HMSC076D02 TaxID=1739439 RepID=UPI0008A653FD|nr:hypothetical protein [Corynebacterium sp. HMSC076D02]OFQ44853.1 hypothetical protein HMPREF2935_07205 [Corynebacterium sp. HMSC076D02]
MGIDPRKTATGVETNYRTDGSDAAKEIATDAEQTGSEASKALDEIRATSESANTGMVELSKRVDALESAPGPDLSGYVTLNALETLPLLLHWDGTGTKPQLKPGWGLFNTSTGKMEE